MSVTGYCHFNTDSSNTSFKIDVFGTELLLWQNPGSKDLGHGAVVWDSSLVLVKYMEHTPKDFDQSKLRRKSVLELGSGCGLAGMAFMMKGANVAFTDLEKIISQLTDRNVRNVYSQLRIEHPTGSFIEPQVFPIDWCDSRDMEKHFSSGASTAEAAVVNEFHILMNSTESHQQIEEGRDSAVIESSATAVDQKVDKTMPGRKVLHWREAMCPPYDIILLTDCVFSAALTEDLVRIIKLCSGPRSMVICCHEIRDLEANETFLQKLSEHFSYKRVPTGKLHPDYCNDQVHIIIAKPLKEKKVKGN